ncbi:hypothetical protein BH23ACI1_BH23ACI1_17400 [soil metagenome]
MQLDELADQRQSDAEPAVSPAGRGVCLQSRLLCIVRLFVRQGGVILLAGLALGLVAALAGGRVIESQLHGTTSRDPLALGTAALAFGVASAAGDLVAGAPSRRHGPRRRPQVRVAAVSARLASQRSIANAPAPLNRKYSPAASIMIAGHVTTNGVAR